MEKIYMLLLSVDNDVLTHNQKLSILKDSLKQLYLNMLVATLKKK